MVNQIKHRLLKLLQYPLVEEAVWLMVLWCFSSVVDLVAYMLYGMPLFAFYYALHGFVIAYVLVFIRGILHAVTLRKLYDFILLGLAGVNVIVDVVCQYNFRTRFTLDFVQIIKATTFRESSEFLQSFVGVVPILICLSVYVLGWYLFNKQRQIRLYTRKWRNVFFTFGMFLLLGTMIITFICRSSNWQSIYVNKLYLFFSEMEDIDLTKYRHSVNLFYSPDSIPQKIVVIVGESHSKHHVGLYGYEKETSPKLQSLYRQGDLIVFQNVKSPACHTLDAFQKILNTYEHEKGLGCQEQKWYESVTLFDIVKAMHYPSFWISNQDKKGIYDNLPTAFSQLCDLSFFAGEGYMVAGRIQQSGNFDSNVIRLYKQHHLDCCSQGLFVFHLMGSHEAFQYRYPKEYDVFKPNDYKHLKSNQRKLIACYDNSVLYNDYILNEIIKLFQKDDALIIYFSDHAIDLFQSDDYYCGHARQNTLSMEAGTDIPFFIYMTKLCQAKHPNIYHEINNNKNQRLNTGLFVPKLFEWCDVRWNKK